MGPKFFETRMGQKFYTSDVPRIATALERIATVLEKNAEDPLKEPSFEEKVIPWSEVDIAFLRFSNRTTNTLGLLKINTVDDLLSYTRGRLKLLKGVGTKVLDEIEYRLEVKGLSLKKETE